MFAQLDAERPSPSIVSKRPTDAWIAQRISNGIGDQLLSARRDLSLNRPLLYPGTGINSNFPLRSN
jgi:hypothetical protein